MKKYWKKNGGILTVVLLLGILASLLAAGVSLVLQRVVDAALAGRTEDFKRLMLFTLVYLLALCGLNFLSSLTAKLLTCQMIRQYRRDIFKGIMNRRPMRFWKENTAEYLSALTNDMKLIEENYIGAVLNTFELMVMFIATLGLLLFLSPLVTAILIGTLCFMFLIPSFIGKLLEKRQAMVSQQMAAFTEKCKDIFSGYEVLKGYGRILNVNRRFAEENEKEISVRFQAARLLALNEGVSDTLSVLSAITVIFVSAYLVMTGHITMGTLLALVQLSSTFIAPVVMLMQNLPKIKSMSRVIARLNVYAGEAEEEGELRESPCFRKEIELRHVSFSYEEGVPVLSDISWRLEKGKKYAVMGQSGCGKSTLIKLLTGYFEHYEGSILYDGKELKTLDPDKVLQLFSVIHQNIYLFNSSVRDNILLGEYFSEEELTQAMEKSGVSLFMNEKEGGPDYQVGENGCLLSGGQRQRVALARALIRNAPVLILDEGTSALDLQTAREIESRMLKEKDITLITITHNPDEELLKRYDRVCEMKEGTLL